jgi:hypothetical protein
MDAIKAWTKWWDDIGHVARCNRDPARTREAFEAGYLAALEQVARAETVRASHLGSRSHDTSYQHQPR